MEWTGILLWITAYNSGVLDGGNDVKYSFLPSAETASVEVKEDTGSSSISSAWSSTSSDSSVTNSLR